MALSRPREQLLRKRELEPELALVVEDLVRLELLRRGGEDLPAVDEDGDAVGPVLERRLRGPAAEEEQPSAPTCTDPRSAPRRMGVTVPFEERIARCPPCLTRRAVSLLPRSCSSVRVASAWSTSSTATALRPLCSESSGTIAARRASGPERKVQVVAPMRPLTAIASSFWPACLPVSRPSIQVGTRSVWRSTTFSSSRPFSSNPVVWFGWTGSWASRLPHEVQSPARFERPIRGSSRTSRSEPRARACAAPPGPRAGR